MRTASALLPDISPASADGPLLVAWVVAGRRALVVGGGEVSTRRARALLQAGARVTLLAPRVTAELRARAARAELEWIPRRFEDGDLDGADLVLAAVDEPETSCRIAAAARARRVPVHVADVPELCDFTFPAIVRDGPVQVGVSTSGLGPALAARLRDRVAAALPDGVGEIARKIGDLREQIRRADPHGSARRMAWLSEFCREAAWETLRALDSPAVAALRRRYVAALPALCEHPAPCSSEASNSPSASMVAAR
jgi:precorrin-2 dehydrogenase/sirohydrochlorin ferrochelatase